MGQPREWKCFPCGKVVQPVHNAAGQVVCPQCAKPVTPVLEHAQAASPGAGAMPQPQPKAKPVAAARPPGIPGEARRPVRPGTSARRSTPAPAPARPATPGEALASSAAWVDDAMSSAPNAPNAPFQYKRPSAGASHWARSPVTYAAAAIIAVLLAIVVILLTRKPHDTATVANGPPSKIQIGPDATAVPADPSAADSHPSATTVPDQTARTPPDTATPAPAPDTTPAPAPAPVVAAPTGRVMDLLAMIDLDRDTIAGQWKQVPGGITSDDAKFARLVLPYDPPEEYDFRIDFTRTASNQESLLQIFRLHQRRCAWVMNGWKGTTCAFSLVSGKNGLDNGTGVKGIGLHAGERHSSVVKVRKDAIEAYVDGKLVTRYETDGSDLSLAKDWNLNNRPLGIGSFVSPTVFHAVEVVEISAKGKLHLGAAAPKKAQ